MTILLLSIWSCVIIYALMVNGKFKWTWPSFGNLSLFVTVGLLAPFIAALFTSWLMRETPLHVNSPNGWIRILTFFVAAGMGEELFKMGACLLVVILLILTRANVRPSIIVLGCVCVGLIFASVENALCYADRVDAFGMLKRSYLAVPLHACMGFIHGLAIERGLRKGAVTPLIVGYVVTVVIHTLYDVMDTVLFYALDATGLLEAVADLYVPAELVYGPVVVPLMIWMILRWRKVGELENLINEEGVDGR